MQIKSKMTIIVTGAAGFIGSHTAQTLAAQGHTVVGIDNFCDFYPRAWKEQNVRDFDNRIRIEEADITDASAVDRLVRQIRPDAIIHLAAMAGVRPSIDDPALYTRVNLDGTTHLLNAAATYNCHRFVFASSSSVYGNNQKVPFTETDDVSNPISPYAATKRAGELICHAFSHLHKINIACLRFFTVYGPRQRPDLAIHKFARLMHFNKPIPFFGDGTTSRDYTFIDDIVAGIIASLHKNAPFRIYNLGGSDPVTLNQLVAGLESAFNKKAVLHKKPAQPGDVERTFADVSRSQSELNYRPTVRLSQGLSRFADWFNANIHRYALPSDPALQLQLPAILPRQLKIPA